MKKRFKMVAYLVSKGYRGLELAEFKTNDLYYLFVNEMRLENKLIDSGILDTIKIDEVEEVKQMAA